MRRVNPIRLIIPKESKSFHSYILIRPRLARPQAALNHLFYFILGYSFVTFQDKLFPCTPAVCLNNSWGGSCFMARCTSAHTNGPFFFFWWGNPSGPKRSSTHSQTTYPQPRPPCNPSPIRAPRRGGRRPLLMILQARSAIRLCVQNGKTALGPSG